MRLHPAASRVAKLAKETPSSFVAFDLLASGGRDRMAAPQRERRALLEKMFTGLRSPLHLTPMTEDRGLAKQWLEQFEGAGLDGVIAKPAGLAYQPGKRAMIKIKHAAFRSSCRARASVIPGPSSISLRYASSPGYRLTRAG